MLKNWNYCLMQRNLKKQVVVLLDVPHNFPDKEEVAFLVDLANDVRSPSLFQTMILIIKFYLIIVLYLLQAIERKVF